MDLSIRGEGRVFIQFIDSTGKTLIERGFATSGTPTIQGRMEIELIAQTPGGKVSLAPILVYQSDPNLKITFDNHIPYVFTKKRCLEIRCSKKVADAAESRKLKTSEQSDVMKRFIGGSLPRPGKAKG